jgi:hypothetical protein
MTNSVAKTYRLPLALYTLMIEEVENTGVSEADFVRLVLRQYFELRQETARIEKMEERLSMVIQTESRGITSLLEQVIALAQPE